MNQENGNDYMPGQPVTGGEKAVIGEHGPEMVIFHPQRDDMRTRLRAWWHRVVGGHRSNRR